MGRRMSSHRFVGRASELRELEQAAEAARKRQPGLLLLGGDSGVGKTRLVGELERLLSERDVFVLRGDAVEQSEGELPYAPLTSALRPLVRADDSALGELSRGSRAQLGALFPGLDDTGAAPPVHDPSSQLRLFEALVELLDCLSERAPVTLILEDMHWADASTRTFVSFLARSLRQEPMLIVLTYRSDELHRRHPLRSLLSELDRLEHVRSLELAPLDREELGEVLADILDGDPGQPLIDRLYARSEGNPLYTEELLAAGLDGRGTPPGSLRDAFMLRIERLSPEAQRAARAIAVGRRLDEALIAEVTGIDRAVLQEALREAVTEYVLTTDEEGRVGFRHALLREVLYDDLLPGERGDLHLALARSLEARTGGGREQEAERAAAMAGHYAAAGDQPAALRTAVQAALAAREVHAYAEAGELAERALELWPRVSTAEQTIPLSRIDLLTLAASAHGVAGDRSRAETLLRMALEAVDAQQQPEVYAGLLARLARIQWSLNRGGEGVQTAQRALTMLPVESRERPALMAWLARTLFLRGRFRDALPDGEAALCAAVEAGDRLAEAEVLNTLGMARIALGDVEAGIGNLQRAIDISRADDDLDTLGYAYGNLADLLLLAGRTREGLEVAREGLANIPARVVRLHDWLTLSVAWLAHEAGDWELMRAHLDPSTVLLDRESVFGSLVQAEAALGEGRDDEAAALLEQVESQVEGSAEPQWIGWFGALQGELHRRRYDLAAARRAVEHALDRLEVCTDDVMRIARASAVGARVEADIARRAKDLRERAEERDALARLDIHVSRLDAAAQEGGPVERAWLAVGKAERSRGRARNEPRLWRQAAAEWDAIDRPYQAALMRWREAEAEVEGGHREAAGAPARAAVALARKLGAHWLADEASALAQRARLQLQDDDNDAPAAVLEVEEEPFGLTPRERQVLALIAEGATNRQIGAALFMAEKTASVHVSRILGKLGVQSRTQAAAVAHRLHLT